MSVPFIEPDLFDLKIYLYTDGETKIMRRFLCDVLERGRNLDYPFLHSICSPFQYTLSQYIER